MQVLNKTKKNSRCSLDNEVSSSVSSSDMEVETFEAIWNRIKKAVGAKSDSDLAKILKLKQQTVWAAKSRKQVPPKWITEISLKYGISADWLLFGEGSMYRGQKAEKPEKTSEKRHLEEEEYVFVPLLESYVTAGPDGGLIFEPKDFYPFKKSWIMRKFGRSSEHWKSLVLLPVRGDSMIPTIYPGEVVLVDTWEAERLEPKSGKIYLIRQPDGGLSIKRLVLKEKGGKMILVCLSDNPNYEPFELEIDPERGIKYYVLGRIRWVGREVD